MAALVKRGAKLDADPYRGTPLLWAASRGRADAVAWLLDHGADVNQRATFGGSGHGDGVWRRRTGTWR
jgi:ankyrin repeat protein